MAQWHCVCCPSLPPHTSKRNITIKLSRYFIIIKQLVRPNFTKSTCANPRVISNTPAKFGASLANVFCAMRGTYWIDTEIPCFYRGMFIIVPFLPFYSICFFLNRPLCICLCSFSVEALYEHFFDFLPLPCTFSFLFFSFCLLPFVLKFNKIKIKSNQSCYSLLLFVFSVVLVHRDD